MREPSKERRLLRDRVLYTVIGLCVSHHENGHGAVVGAHFEGKREPVINLASAIVNVTTSKAVPVREDLPY